MSLSLQIIFLVCATVSALRPAHFARQFETCGVACGGGWCCAQFESCVATPADTVDGGWSCIFQGVSNDDGSPITDEAFNPSADAAIFNSISDFVSQQSSFISSLTSALSITSLSMQSISSLPSAGFAAPTVAPSTSPSIPSSTAAAGTSLTSASPSPTVAASSKAPTSSPASVPSSISSSTTISTSSTKASGSSSPSSNATTTPSIILASNTSSIHFRSGIIAALISSLICVALVAYFI